MMLSDRPVSSPTTLTDMGLKMQYAKVLKRLGTRLQRKSDLKYTEALREEASSRGIRFKEVIEEWG